MKKHSTITRPVFHLHSLHFIHTFLLGREGSLLILRSMSLEVIDVKHILNDNFRLVSHTDFIFHTCIHLHDRRNPIDFELLCSKVNVTGSQFHIFNNFPII